jgi:zinc transport system substrate-binding protein
MTNRVPALVAISFFVMVLVLVMWIGLPKADNPLLTETVSVVTTIYPLQDFARQVGGDYVEVSNVVPAGGEPHDFEPTPRQVVELQNADVVIFIGAGLDAWAETAAAEAGANGAQVLKIEDVVDMVASEEDGLDPHVWLDLALAQDIATAMAESLGAADPEHASEYAAHAAAYVQKLKNLDTAYTEGLRGCELNDIIVSHDAFSYPARRYGFTLHPISGLSPEAEPSVRDLSNLAKTAQDLGVTTIFFETLVSPKLAETLAAEVGAQTAVLNPLEGLSAAEVAAGKDYISVMEDNLQALRTALVCP